MRRIWAAIVAVGLVSVAACSSGTHEARSTPRPRRHSATATPRPSRQPFTGTSVGVNHRVLATKIDNTRTAHPQYGLRQADIVYTEQVEGGETRIMAIYSSHLPARVGPVRSARISDLHLLRQFGHPALAYSGAQHKLLPRIAAASVYDVSPDHAAAAYQRIGGRPIPYNLLASPAKLLRRAPRASRAHDIGFAFGAAPAGGVPRRSVTVRYPEARFTFVWSQRAGKWLVDADGVADRAAEGGRLGAPTVVVQWCKTTRSPYHDFLGNYTPLIETTGTGTGVVLRDGRAYAVHWSRRSERSGTTYTTSDGKRMRFHPGQVWVMLAARKPHIP